MEKQQQKPRTDEKSKQIMWNDQMLVRISSQFYDASRSEHSRTRSHCNISRIDIFLSTSQKECYQTGCICAYFIYNNIKRNEIKIYREEKSSELNYSGQQQQRRQQWQRRKHQ